MCGVAEIENINFQRYVGFAYGVRLPPPPLFDGDFIDDRCEIISRHQKVIFDHPSFRPPLTVGEDFLLYRQLITPYNSSPVLRGDAT